MSVLLNVFCRPCSSAGSSIRLKAKGRPFKSGRGTIGSFSIAFDFG